MITLEHLQIKCNKFLLAKMIYYNLNLLVTEICRNLMISETLKNILKYYFFFSEV